MRVAACAPVLLVLLLCLVAGAAEENKKADEKKKEDVKVVTVDLEERWGTKYKSHTVEDVTDGGIPKKKVKVLLEFAKNATEDELRVMRALFGPGPSAQLNYQLWVYCFDEDNVSIGKFELDKPEKEVSGRKGDAFRLIVAIDAKTFMKTCKIEAREGEKERK